MAVSKNQIIKANHEYYFDTYAKSVTRAHWWISLTIVILVMSLIVVNVRAFLRLSYIRQAAQQPRDIDVAEWVDNQFVDIQNWLIFAFVLLALVMLSVLLYFWKTVKSYELYKYKKRYIGVVLGITTIGIAVACIITGVMASSGKAAVFEFGILVVSLCPMWSGGRLFIPREITPLPKEDITWVIKLINLFLDGFSRLYLDEK